MKDQTNKNQRKYTDVTDAGGAAGMVVRRVASGMLDELMVSGTTLTESGLLSLSDQSFHALSVRIGRKTPVDALEDSVARMLRDEVLINAEKIERQCAGAGYLFAVVFLRTLARTGGDALSGQTGARQSMAATFEKVRAGLIKQFVKVPGAINPKTGFLSQRSAAGQHSCVATALNVAGLLGSVSVEKYHDISGGSESIIGRSSGHQFRVDMMRTFLGSVSLGEFGTWQAKEVRVLIVDGVVNTVAEIDKVLLGASRTKQPLLVIASYFEEEVVATVAANNLAGKTNIFLALLPRDSLDGVNMASDIATCCLSQTINPHAGYGMLSFLEFDSLAVVDEVKVTPASNTLSVTNPKAHGAVMAQMKRLQEKTTELKQTMAGNKALEASLELLNKRITNLVSDRVVIKVPSSQANVMVHLIDNDIRLIKSLLEYGELINTKPFRSWLADLCSQSTDPVLKLTGSVLVEELGRLQRNKRVVVGMTPYIVLWFASALAGQYLNTDYAVVTVRS